MKPSLLDKYEILYKSVKHFYEVKEKVDQQEKIVSGLIKQESDKREGPSVFLWLGVSLGVIIGWAILPFIGSIIGLFALGILGMKMDKTVFGNRNNLKANAFHNSIVAPASEKLESLKNELSIALQDSHFKDAINPDIVPERYQSLHAFEFFVTALKSKRADTEKELYKLYESELQHLLLVEKQDKMILQSKALLDENRKYHNETSEQLNGLAKDTSKIVKRTRYENIVGTLNYLKK